MARVSRPPGFDMTYRPAGSVSFGPPIRERWATLLYVAVAVVICGVILYGQNAPSNSWIFRYVVEGDRSRIISSSVCAIILGISAAAALARESMRGVVVHPDGIETRELLSLGWPRVRRLQWQQIDRMLLPSAKAEGGAARRTTIRVDLWDGSRTRLPPVGNWVDLAVMLEKVALARAIPVEGGTGLVDDFLVDEDEQEVEG
jgi:hypothetical protein